MRLAIEGQGHTVIEARDQPEAIQNSTRSGLPSCSPTFACPDGDGFGVLRAAKELDAELPVVVMTAYGSIQDAVAAMKEGALDFSAEAADPITCCCCWSDALAQSRMVE